MLTEPLALFCRKRASLRTPQLSNELAAVWSPLLSRLDEQYDSFSEALLARMVDVLGTATPATSDAAPGAAGIVDKSYAQTISVWIVHLLQSSEDPAATEMVVKSCLTVANPR